MELQREPELPVGVSELALPGINQSKVFVKNSELRALAAELDRFLELFYGLGPTVRMGRLQREII